MFVLALVKCHIAAGSVLTIYGRSTGLDHVSANGIWVTREHSGNEIRRAPIVHSIRWARGKGTMGKTIPGVGWSNSGAIGLYKKAGFALWGGRRL